MEQYKHYLQTKAYRPRTVHIYTSALKHFKTWLREENIPVKDIRYPDLLAYINILTEKGDQAFQIVAEVRYLSTF